MRWRFPSRNGVAVEQLASKSISEVLSEPEGDRLAQVSYPLRLSNLGVYRESPVSGGFMGGGLSKNSSV